MRSIGQSRIHRPERSGLLVLAGIGTYVVFFTINKLFWQPVCSVACSLMLPLFPGDFGFTHAATAFASMHLFTLVGLAYFFCFFFAAVCTGANRR